MTDATLNPLPPGVLPAGVERKDASVLTQKLNPVLLRFLAVLGQVHLHLFDTPVVITSAVDATHAPGSKHFQGNAVDIRLSDLTPESQMILILIVRRLSLEMDLAYFDETMLPGAGHLHVEIAG